MSQRAHRVLKIVYAEGIFFVAGTPLGDAVTNYSETNDFRNQEGGGNIEITLGGLQTILGEAEEWGLLPEDVSTLQEEINDLISLGKSVDDYIIYDIF
jgi:hypothetical protein